MQGKQLIRLVGYIDKVFLSAKTLTYHRMKLSLTHAYHCCHYHSNLTNRTKLSSQQQFNSSIATTSDDYWLTHNTNVKVKAVSTKCLHNSGKWKYQILKNKYSPFYLQMMNYSEYNSLYSIKIKTIGISMIPMNTLLMVF